MGRNRTLGSPYQTQTVTSDFTTNHSVDAYMVDAVPLVVTLDPFAANNDQVAIQDVTNAAAAHPIVINVSEGQTILNGFGDTISISTNGGSVLLTMTSDGWAPQVLPTGGGSGTTGATGVPGATGATGAGTTGATGVGTTGATGVSGSPGGTTGATGVSGATGTAGATGAGTTGATGVGTTGATGVSGSPGGTTGATGVSGAAGTTGATGVGTAGTTGATGAAGTPGVFATIGVAITGSQTFGNSNTTIGTTTYTASAGEFALVFVSEQLTVTSSTASGFNMAVTCTGVGAQPIDQPGPFADGTGAIVPFVGKFGPLSAGSVTINVEVSTNTSGATGETISGSMLILRSTN